MRHGWEKKEEKNKSANRKTNKVNKLIDFIMEERKSNGKKCYKQN